MIWKANHTLPLLLGVAVLGAGGWYGWSARHGAGADGLVHANGRIEMTHTDVAVKYPGRLAAVLVAEGDSVRAGQVVALEDDTDLKAQLAGALAARARAEAAVQRASGEADARHQQQLAAAIDWREAGKLQSQAMVSPIEVEQRRIALDGAAAAATAAAGGVAEARAAIAQADAQIAQLRAALADMRLVAPRAGRVEYRVVEPGAILPAGGKVLSLVDPADAYLTVFLPARAAGRLHLGDEARVLPEGFDRALAARVSFVSPEAQFTPKFVETASERDTLTYRVKLRIPPPAQPGANTQLKAGMSADGYLRADPARPWPALPAPAPAKAN